jgi:hypothetical protein
MAACLCDFITGGAKRSGVVERVRQVVRGSTPQVLEADDGGDAMNIDADYPDTAPFEQLADAPGM